MIWFQDRNSTLKFLLALDNISLAPEHAYIPITAELEIANDSQQGDNDQNTRNDAGIEDKVGFL